MKIKLTTKKLVAFIGAVIIILGTVSSMFVYAVNTGNYMMIGSKDSLGSPLLDTNFTSDQWNRWEMLTWGIYLSNFAFPLIDDYESAFTSGAGGSNGSGFKALNFGGASDPSNNKTLTGLLNYAIGQQKQAGLKNIYVSFNPLAYGEVIRDGKSVRDTVEDTEEENDEDELSNEDDTDNKQINDKAPIKGRQAKFRDLFIQVPVNGADDIKGDASNSMGSPAENASWVDTLAVKDRSLITALQDDLQNVLKGKIAESDTFGHIVYNDGYKAIVPQYGMLPEFKIATSSGYETIWDLGDGWDLQMLTAWLGRVSKTDVGDDFNKNFQKLYDENPEIKLDCFGNIVIGKSSLGKNLMVLPSACNQHLTSSPKYNLVTSLLFNGYGTNVTADDLVSYVSAEYDTGWNALLTEKMFRTGRGYVGGTSPISNDDFGSLPKGQVVFLYDTDTIRYAEEYLKKKSLPAGEMVKSLFDLDANKKLGNKYGFKIEVVGMDSLRAGDGESQSEKALRDLGRACESLSSTLMMNTNVSLLSTIKTRAGDLNLFGDAVVISPNMQSGKENASKFRNSYIVRQYSNYLYQSYNSKNGITIAGLPVTINKDYISSELMKLTKPSDIAEWAYFNIKDKYRINPIFSSFVSKNPQFYNTKGMSVAEIASLEGSSVRFGPNGGGLEFTERLKDQSWFTNNFTFEAMNEQFKRMIKVYPTSSVMSSVSNILGLRDGTEFSVFSTNIYMTYLDWYGITSGIKGANGDSSHEFNTKIFDAASDFLNIKIDDIIDTPSKEDMKKDILNYTYMILHPTKGREYRSDMIKTGISDWIYDTYQTIVYGKSMDSYSGINSNLSTRNATGFLNIDSYSENFMTGWFMKIYSTAAIYILGVMLIAIILVGIIKGRKFTWYILAFAITMNCVLITPSMGEVTPYVANNTIQNMFSNKMTFWGITEAVENAQMEADYVNKTAYSNRYMQNLTKEEMAQVVELVKTFNVVYLDRALMVKTDISKKITEAQLKDYASLQSLQSARWMLPMVMRQFTANDTSADYVFIPLGDIYDNLSNMYWYYNPLDSQYVDTVNAKKDVANDSGTKIIPSVGKALSTEERSSYFADYKDVSFAAQSSLDNTNLSLGNEKYNSSPGWHSISRSKDNSSLPHTYFYLLDGINLPTRGVYTDGKFDSYVKDAIQNTTLIEAFKTSSMSLETTAGSYNPFDRSTLHQSYGYLWTTENPYHYFYQVIKDTFDPDITLGRLVGELQGSYKSSELLGIETRNSFMHYQDTGKIRDILDAEELFTNVIPYIYQMQIVAGGFNGKSGVLGSEKITDYDLYKNNNKSWLYRSNWVTKLMESSYSNSTTVTDKEGKKYKIQNPLLPDCYPDERQMVFSEAEMYARGLNESNLNLVELKILEVNKQVEKSWTKMLNYISQPGMTKEVAMRHMATEAIISFNREFSPDNLLNKSLALYPNGLDLRSISFDSVMKMLMLNTTKDSSYIYGDTMKLVVEESDIFTSMLLLISAFLCAYIIPLGRNVVLGLIFFLGFVAMLYSLLADGKTKAKVSCGYLVSNIIFLAMTLGYYSIFSTLMAITSTDDVITVQSVQINAGNPVWVFIIIIIASGTYIYGIGKMINFCFKHYRDMGFEVYASVASTVTNNVSESLYNLGDKISNQTNSSLSGRYMSKSASKNSVPVTVESGNVETKYKDTDKPKTKDYEDANILRTSKNISDDYLDSKFIEEQIKKGKISD